MPVEKGPVTPAWWQVLKVSLELSCYFTKNNCARRDSGGFVLLRLQREDPDIAAAVAAAYDDPDCDDAEVYAVRCTSAVHMLVFGARDGVRKLVYPARIDGSLEAALRSSAARCAQRGSASFLFYQRRWWLWFVAYPLLGLAIAVLGASLLFTSQGGYITPPVVVSVSALTIAVGLGVFVFPVLYSLAERRKLRHVLRGS